MARSRTPITVPPCASMIERQIAAERNHPVDCPLISKRSFNERQAVHEFRLHRDAVLHRFPDHLGRSMAVLSDASERLPHLLQIRRSTIQPSQRRLGIGDRRGDRLVHFMGDRCGELPHRCNPMNMGELVLRVQARLFSPPALGHVDRGADEFDKIAGRVENRVAQWWRYFIAPSRSTDR